MFYYHTQLQPKINNLDLIEKKNEIYNRIWLPHTSLLSLVIFTTFCDGVVGGWCYTNLSFGKSGDLRW